MSAAAGVARPQLLGPARGKQYLRGRCQHCCRRGELGGKLQQRLLIAGRLVRAMIHKARVDATLDME